MKCNGCYKDSADSYCRRCRQQLFDGNNISHILEFDPPLADNLSLYQEKTKRLSISGVQLKYSLRFEGKKLVLTDTGGQYIIKPIPPAVQLAEANQAPENEHLTMQIAAQLYGINTAANGIIYFKDGTPAYITRRFDLRADGSKYLQEDMAQISNRSRQRNGENFKYEGTYEEIGLLIKKYVPASMPALENYFRIVIFNYLVSNGDAHLKNFSLIQGDMGDQLLSPAYDLLNTFIHVPGETDTALQLYNGDIDAPFYSVYGFYGQESFRELGRKIGLLPQRIERILTQLLSKNEELLEMIRNSSLADRVKQQYIERVNDKIRRMGMTPTMISRRMNSEFPGVYAPTTKLAILNFLAGKQLKGYFQYTKDSPELQKDNKYTFVDLSKPDDIDIIDGDALTAIHDVEDQTL